jgi:hypothetical protein
LTTVVALPELDLTAVRAGLSAAATAGVAAIRQQTKAAKPAAQTPNRTPKELPRIDVPMATDERIGKLHRRRGVYRWART